MRTKKFCRLRLACLVLFSGLLPFAHAALPTPDPDNGGIILPEGFHALVVADRLGPIRFITVATNGDIYIKRTRRGVYSLHDSAGNGRMDVVHTNCMEIGSGTGVAIHNGWLYVSSDDAVYRYKLEPGQLDPVGPPEAIVVGLPPGQQEHESKAFTFDDQDNIYVEVGCPSNASGDPDRAFGAKGVDPAGLFMQHGGFWRFKAGVANQDQVKDGFHFSTGMRHALSVAWNDTSKSLFVVMMGRDQLNTVDPTDYTAEDNAENPAEEMHILKQGANFGWPYTYWDPRKNARMLSPEFGGDNKKTDTSKKYPDPDVAFPAHWAMMQMAFYTGAQFPAKYRNGAFVASHGSWNRAPLPQAGYKVAFVPFNDQGMPAGGYEVFADNFAGIPVIRSTASAHYRPCGVAIGPDGSLYVADSERGRVWRIIYTGDSAAAGTPGAPAAMPAAASPTASKLPGARIYAMVCATCHMADGTGVPRLQPPLVNDPIISGDANQLIRVVLEGPAKVLPADRTHYSNTMPPMKQLKDQQIADVLTYVRTVYGGNAPAVTADQVSNIRNGADNATPTTH